MIFSVNIKATKELNNLPKTVTKSHILCEYWRHYYVNFKICQESFYITNYYDVRLEYVTFKRFISINYFVSFLSWQSYNKICVSIPHKHQLAVKQFQCNTLTFYTTFRKHKKKQNKPIICNNSRTSPIKRILIIR